MGVSSVKKYPLVLVDGPALQQAFESITGNTPRFDEKRLRDFLLAGLTAPREFTRYYWPSMSPKDHWRRLDGFLWHISESWRIRRTSQRADRVAFGVNWMRMDSDADEFLMKSADHIARLVLVCARKEMHTAARAYREHEIPVTLISGVGQGLQPEEGDTVISIEQLADATLIRDSEWRDSTVNTGNDTRPARAAE